MCGFNVSKVVTAHLRTRLDRLQIEHDNAGRIDLLSNSRGCSAYCDNLSSKARYDSKRFPDSELRCTPDMNVSTHHPRFLSLATRERLAKAMSEGIVVPQGLIAHGRGEAFDYILGEETLPAATAATAGKEIVNLSAAISAPIEVNLFHRTSKRERLIASYLKRLGAGDVLGVGKSASSTIRGIASSRRQTDPRGIGKADVVLIPLEDGDRAEALSRDGKKTIAIDLNPLSRTSRAASVSIVDNVIRAIPALTHASYRLKKMRRTSLERLASDFDNQRNLAGTIKEMIEYLRG